LGGQVFLCAAAIAITELWHCGLSVKAEVIRASKACEFLIMTI
jgi:hypothetical protein